MTHMWLFVRFSYYQIPIHNRVWTGTITWPVSLGWRCSCKFRQCPAAIQHQRFMISNPPKDISQKKIDFKSTTIFEKMKVSQAVLLLASNSAAVQQVVDKTRQLDIELSVDDSSRSGNFLILFPKSSLMWSWIHREPGEYLVGKFQKTSWYYQVNLVHDQRIVKIK